MAIGAKGSFKKQSSHYLFSTISPKGTIYLPKSRKYNFLFIQCLTQLEML